MTLQERLAMTQGQDNGMDIILGGIPAAAQQEQVQQLPATALRPKSNHTFKVRTGSPHYTALVDSIRSSGIRTPLLVRRDPVQPGAYEIIAGHTRWTAAQELELATVPCIVAQLSDADADIMMAETNIQRPDWLPSERAKTYKVWLEAVQTETGITQGQRTDTTSGTECPKLGRNRDVAAQRFGIGPKTLDMYIKLNDLIPELLDMVDANAVDSKTGKVLAGPDLVSRGFVYVRESEELMDGARVQVEMALDCSMADNMHDWASVKSRVREALSSYIYRKTKRSPMILPILMEV